jgi:hypothetical protein
VRIDRGGNGGGHGYITTSNVHPLTPQAAGLLLREPQLGVAVPAAYLRSRNRIATGQRFFVLEPLGVAGALALPVSAAGRQVAARLAPSRAWISVDPRRSRITVGFYLSEAETQRIVAAIRKGSGGTPLLQALTAAYRAMEQRAPGGARILREDGEDFEGFAAKAARLLPAGFRHHLRRRLGGWVLPALANWVKTNSEAFVRAAGHPDTGVTIRVQLTSVPGLSLLGQAAKVAGAGVANVLNAVRGTPGVSILVTAGRTRR